MLQDQAIRFVSNEEREAFSRIEQAHFGFHHHLGRSPLLDLGALRNLAAFMQSRNLPYFFKNGDKGLESGWGAQPQGVSLLSSFDALADGNVLIMLKGVHRHPEYAKLLDRFLLQVGDLLNVNMAKAYQRPICTIIIASPRRITPYHIDDSHNLLMQVRGEKDFYVFDGSDPDILSDQERQAFWHGNVNAAVLTVDKQSKASVYKLGPGLGVHVPVTYPHWAQNGDDISVAVSINFQSVHDRTVDIHAFNNFLRARGFHPRAPGESRIVDSSKVVAFRALNAIRHLSPGSTA